MTAVAVRCRAFDARKKLDKVMRPQPVSIIAPIRNCESEMIGRLDRLVADIPLLGISEWDLLAVDDGSRDQTVAHVIRWAGSRERFRLIRHPRPRGFEAAGQTGLERSSGALAFILDPNVRYCTEDFAKLLEQVSSDEEILGAQLERCIRPLDGHFQRRLQLCGIQFVDASPVDPDGDENQRTRLQVFRRTHLSSFASRSVPRPKMTRSVEESTRILSRRTATPS